MAFTIKTKSLAQSLPHTYKGAENSSIKDAIYWGKNQTVTGLTTFKKAEALHATPQDLSTVLRWAGGMCFLAGPATLD